MRNRFVLTLIAALLAAPAAVPGQTASAAPASAASSPTFDVASVRPAAQIDQAKMIADLRAGKRPQSSSVDGLRVTYTYMSLKELISFAYNVRPYQVSGPDWLVSDRFDIAAKMPEGSTKSDVPAMLKALLADRFKLTAHLETKDQPVLGLMVGKSGPKLKDAATPPQPVDESAPLDPGQTKVDNGNGTTMLLTKNPDGSTTYNLGTRGTFTLRFDGETRSMHMNTVGMSMQGFAMMMTLLGGGSGRPIVDQTGLKGNYEMSVEFSMADLMASLRDQGLDVAVGAGAPAGGGASDPDGDSTVSDALGKLGLKLEKSRASIEQLVIDHVEKNATAN
jgi:uncharacterized protein (TIGR03435 family)